MLQRTGSCRRYRAILYSYVQWLRQNQFRRTARALLPKTAPEALGVEINLGRCRTIASPNADVRSRPPTLQVCCMEASAWFSQKPLPAFMPAGISIYRAPFRWELKLAEAISDPPLTVISWRGATCRSSLFQKLAVHTVEIVHEESGQVLCLSRVTNYYKEIEPVRGLDRLFSKSDRSLRVG